MAYFHQRASAVLWMEALDHTAGIVDAVGPGVTTFKPGDAVVARADGAYAQYVLATLDSVVLKPGSFTFGQAAGIPVAGIAYLSRGSRGKDQARPAGGGDRCPGRRGLAPPWTPPCPWGTRDRHRAFVPGELPARARARNSWEYCQPALRAIPYESALGALAGRC
jgi:hypothetical protein